jgi:pyrrolidone-carboxylate peptidase
MQVRLKRNGLFANDIDFETSIVTKGSELDNMIKLFEEKSRNYTDIDFSKAGNKKKVLITGFDPFVLNSGKYSWADINTQNPSGISALNFHGKMIGNAYIQCAIVPVRYEDFDNGIIENIVQNNINQFDIMMTMSRNDSNFDIERFACKFRGGFFDNMNIGNDSEYVKMEYPNLKLGDWNKSRFKQIYSGNEFYETTLPIAKILVGDLAPSKKIVFFDQTVKDDAGFESKHPNKGGVSNTISKIFSSSSVTGKSIEHSGSGGDYLSNEIMYRATRKRDELGMQNIKGVGHIHINDSLDFKQVLNILTKIVTNATN